jgi:hypothetical protein
MVHPGADHEEPRATTAWWKQAYRSLAYGQPIIVVSGLPRSGTSMMMKMLEAGGVPVWQDGLRVADDQNPHGYYELERVKELDTSSDKGWVRQGRGQAVKVVSALLDHLPRTNNYQVVFMRRDLEEVLASQARMLAARGHTDEGRNREVLRQQYEAHLRKVADLLSEDPAFSVVYVRYTDVLHEPRAAAERLARFLGRRLDVARMTRAVDTQLYRNRRAQR